MLTFESQHLAFESQHLASQHLAFESQHLAWVYKPAVGRRPPPPGLRPHGAQRFRAKREQLKTFPESQDQNLALTVSYVPYSISDTQGWLAQRMGGVPREQKMLKGHLTRVIYHQEY